MTDSSQSQSQKDEENKSQINSEKASSNKSSIASSFLNTIENSKKIKELGKLIELKSDLEELKNPLIKFEEENKILNELYENEDKMTNEINQEKNNYQFNDLLFEENAIKILADVFELKEFNLYPHFDVGFSEKKRIYATCIFYYRINFQISDNNESKNTPDEKSKSFSIYFLDDRETFMAQFQEIPMIFQKEDGAFNSVRVISKTYDFISDFPLKKIGQEYEAFIPFWEIKDDLIEIQKMIIKEENIRDSTDNSQEKIKAEENLKTYKEKVESLKIKYSEKTIKKTLQDKKNELSQLEKDEKLDQNEKDQRKQNLLNEIKELEELLKGIIIKIIRRSQEFDGFFFTTKEIILKNNIGGVLTIPAQKPIIVEAKHISNYKSLLDNIRDKRKLLQALGLNVSKFYYVGILRRISDDKKLEAIQSIELSNKENIIIIYPDKWDFLGFPLYKLKKEIIEKKETKNDKETSLKEEKIEKKNTYNNLLMDMRNELEITIRDIFQREIEPLKQEVKGLRSDMNKLKGDVDKLKDGMDKLKDDMDKVKKKINID